MLRGECGTGSGHGLDAHATQLPSHPEVKISKKLFRPYSFPEGRGHAPPESSLVRPDCRQSGGRLVCQRLAVVPKLRAALPQTYLLNCAIAISPFVVWGVLFGRGNSPSARGLVFRNAAA